MFPSFDVGPHLRKWNVWGYIAYNRLAVIFVRPDDCFSDVETAVVVDDEVGDARPLSVSPVEPGG